MSKKFERKLDVAEAFMTPQANEKTPNATKAKKAGRPSKNEQLKQQTVYLPAVDLKKGKIAAAKSDTTISKVLEEALKEWLDKNY